MSTSLWTKAEPFGPQDIVSPGTFTRGLKGIVDRLSRQIRRRRAYADLAALDDRTLKDIGLDRGMLLGAAYEASHRFDGGRLRPWPKRPVRLRDRGARLLSCLVDMVVEARKRAAARDLRRFEASLGPNQLKEFSQRIDDLPVMRPTAPAELAALDNGTA